MADLSINDRIMSSLKSLTTNKTASTELQSEIDLQMTDWMTLLVAQLQNQTMDNQVDTNEMMGQLAQYAQIQAIQDMVSMQEDLYSMSYSSYAASLIGKEVTAAAIETVTNSTGVTEELVTTKGVVTGVTLFEGEPYVYVGDKQFALSQIMIVGNVEEKTAEEETPEVEGTEGTEGVTGSEGTGEAGNGEAGTEGSESVEGTTGTGTGTEAGAGAETGTEAGTESGEGTTQTE